LPVSDIGGGSFKIKKTRYHYDAAFFFMLSSDKRIMQCGVERMCNCPAIKLVVIHFVGRSRYRGEWIRFNLNNVA